MIQPSAEDFLQACGTPASLTLEVEHRERRTSERQTLALPFAVVGRDERADIRLEDEEVSHRHAYLQVVAGQLWCVDLGSRTGTLGENGEPFPGPLLGHQGIRIGPYTLRRVDDATPNEEDRAAAPANPLTNDSDDPALLPRLALEIRGGAVRQHVWLVDRPLTLIGRASFCKVRLHSPLVSRAHAALVNTAAGPWLIDLLGREGISINGTAARWARLEPEDEIQIDQFRLRLRYLAPPTGALEVSAQVRRDPSVSAMMLSDPSRRNDAASSLLQAFVPPAPVQLMNGSESVLLPLITQFSQMQQQMFDQFQQTLLLMAQTFGNLHQGQMALVRQELDQIQDLTRQLQALQVESARQPPALPPAPAPPPRLEPLSRPTPSEPSAAVKPTDAPAIPRTPRSEGDVHARLAQRLAELQQERQSRWQRIVNLLTGK